jgi:hypothetical protein
MMVLPEAKTRLSRAANRKANASPSSESDGIIILNTKHYILGINHVRTKGKKKAVAFQIRNLIFTGGDQHGDGVSRKSYQPRRGAIPLLFRRLASIFRGTDRGRLSVRLEGRAG